MEARLEGLEVRVHELETWRNRETTRAAVAEVHAKNMNERFDRIDGQMGELKDQLKTMYGGLWKVIFVVFSLFAGAFVTFIVAGGLVG